MKVLVLGGTGAMGVHLIEFLSNNSNETYVTSRTKRESVGKIHYIHGNAQDIEFLKTILKEQWDAIVDFMVYTTANFKDQVNLLLGATSQYVFISTARVFADSKEPIKELSCRLLDKSTDEEFLSTDEYSLTKARQEDILINSGFSNWTIIRPYITYSQTRLQLGVLEKEDWLYRALQGRTIIFSKDLIFKLTTLTFGLDVSKVIFAVLGDPNALGNTFNIMSSKPNTWSEILDVYLNILEKHLGKRPKVLLQNLDSFFEHHPGKYQVLYDRIYDRHFDNKKIYNYIDTEEFIIIEDGLKSCLEEFLINPYFKKIDWHKEALKDRSAKEHASLTEINKLTDKIIYIVHRYLKIKNS